ncbi:MAG: iron-sulfur cluster assembly accessory protein [Bacteriovoracaceae bacterium]|jgi:iron-sulfur cluster assembly protein|nr:iron-sulfur cluster assembly accessory protein [Halobacteriovoraceae bacterium]MDP7321820.1 iron-sulfur cluster assembly accessory protein [Bacteriovoracaceae bacterium]|tara:strand:- start:80 stop:418 length:339 start_codon:yes stop_codon:yes gene_type:complete
MLNNEIINVTDKAFNQIKTIFLSENPGPQKGLRLAVVGGGCSGLQYKIEFSEHKEKDNVIENDNIRIFVDPKSSIYLKDVVLDYQDGLNGKGFVFENPNATNTCGCGESFSV